MTKKEIADYFRKFGREGGTARAKNMTKEQRSEASRRAAQARWRKKTAQSAVAPTPR